MKKLIILSILLLNNLNIFSADITQRDVALAQSMLHEDPNDLILKVGQDRATVAARRRNWAEALLARKAAYDQKRAEEKKAEEKKSQENPDEPQPMEDID